MNETSGFPTASALLNSSQLSTPESGDHRQFLSPAWVVRSRTRSSGHMIFNKRSCLATELFCVSLLAGVWMPFLLTCLFCQGFICLSARRYQAPSISSAQHSESKFRFRWISNFKFSGTKFLATINWADWPCQYIVVTDSDGLVCRTSFSVFIGFLLNDTTCQGLQLTLLPLVSTELSGRPGLWLWKLWVVLLT